MMMRRAAITLIGALALLVGVGVTNSSRAGQVIKIGTLAPASSPWGQVLKVWADSVSTKSGGAVQLQLYFSGQLGDEASMVSKMKSSQLDGAVVTAVGLGKIYQPILALQMPGLFSTWDKLDNARNTMKAEFEKGCSNAGFLLAGWGDVGAVHFMSKGIALRTPEVLRDQKPFMWRDDPMQTFLYQAIGGVVPVPLYVPEVLSSLNIGKINVIRASSLAAEQLQWSSKLDTIHVEVNALEIGAIVLSSKKLDTLSADQKAIVVDAAKSAAAELTKRIRKDDNDAFGRLKGKMTLVTLSSAEKSKWDALYKTVRQQLAQSIFSPELVARLEELAK